MSPASPDPRIPGASRIELARALNSVRRRWRFRILLQGVALLGACAMALVLLGAWGVELSRFAPWAVTVVRVLVGAGLLVGGWFLVLRPLLEPVPDERIALYLEEHAPGLDGAVLAALAARDSGLGRPLLAAALERLRAARWGRAIERRAVGRSSAILAATALVTVLVLAFGPTGFRQGAATLVRADAAPPPPPERIVAVEPGNVTVSRGADQLVAANLIGFGSGAALPEATLHARAEEDGGFRPVTMVPADTLGGFELLLFSVRSETEYFVEAGGVRTPVYRIDVVDLPWVEEVELTLRFPDFTGLAPQVISPGGDVAALLGTTVQVIATTTVPVSGGRILLDDARTMELAVDADGRVRGSFPVDADGTWQLEFDPAGGGDPIPGSPRYLVRALADRSPLVRFTRPGRDTRPSAIEEVYLEARAEDDYGVRTLELVYSVNGGEERSVTLFGDGTRPLPEVLVGHTLFLEEYDLSPGDVVAYHARASDGTSEPVLSDLYFLQVRPFGFEYRQGDPPPGGGDQQGQGEGGGEGEEGALSEQQRQVISAAFNLRRDRSRYSDNEFEQGAVAIGIAQRRLQEQVATLLQRMGNRGAAAMDDEGFRRVAESLPAAMEEMDRVLEALGDAPGAVAPGAPATARGATPPDAPDDTPREPDLEAALPPAQRALQHLIRVEEAFREVTVTQAQQGGGQGGGGGGGAAQDLADLFELELDQLRNQYETVQRRQQAQQSTDQQVDETLERLRDLARRQELEAERQRTQQRAGEAGAQGGDPGNRQRELADQAEEVARQLERLAREQRQPELAESARRLEEAADAMRRSAAGRQGAGAAEAQAAADRLDEARRRLEQAQSDRVARDAREALDRAEALADRQRAVAGRADENRTGPMTPERFQELRQIDAEKEQMTRETQELEARLERLAAEARREDRGEVARALDDAARGMREDQLADRIRFSRGLLDTREEEYARAFEGEITRAMDDLVDRVAQAQRAASTPGSRDAMARALERSRDLVRGAESMEERTRGMGQRPGEPGEPGQSGEAGQQGEPGQQGQGQGQQAEPGQQGQQGQGQQGQGQQGQQGQGGQGGQPGQPGQSGDPSGQRGGAGGGGSAMGGTPESGRLGGIGAQEQLSQEQIRQLRREARERLADVEALGRELGEAGIGAGELGEVTRSLRALDSQGVYGDLAELMRVQTRLVEASRRLEFALRRELDGRLGERPRLSGLEEIPEEYRRWVEEYYRSLSRGGGGG